MLIFNGVMGKCRISFWSSLIRDLLDTALLQKKKKKKAVLAHPFTAKCPPNQPHRQNHMWSAWCRRRKKNEESREDFCLTCMYSHSSRSRQAGCISCSTWMNSAAEHAQVMLSKGQFELSQTGVEPLILMLSRFHFSRALFWFTTAVLSLSHPLPFSTSFCCLSDFLCSKLSSSREEKQLGDW